MYMAAVKVIKSKIPAYKTKICPVLYSISHKIKAEFVYVINFKFSGIIRISEKIKVKLLKKKNSEKKKKLNKKIKKKLKKSLVELFFKINEILTKNKTTKNKIATAPI